MLSTKCHTERLQSWVKAYWLVSKTEHGPKGGVSILAPACDTCTQSSAHSRLCKQRILSTAGATHLVLYLFT